MEGYAWIGWDMLGYVRDLLGYVGIWFGVRFRSRFGMRFGVLFGSFLESFWSLLGALGSPLADFW